MDPATILLVLAALLVGAAVGAYIARRRRPAPDPEEPFAQPEANVPDGVSDILAMLDSAGVVVGPHDEVLEATDTARNLGLVRGTRIAVPELLALARDVRRERRRSSQNLEIKRGSHAATTYLVVHVAPLGDDLLVVLADDQTTARRVDETRRDFIANTSHELKTPIGAIGLLAEAVEDAADDPQAVRRFATRMGIESARLSDLVNQILELSRLQSDNPLTRPEVIEVDDVLAEAVDRSRVDADRRGVALTIAGASGCRVLGSARQLGVAVGNLVENAVIYSDPGARVVVAANVDRRSDDDYAEITVSDTGIGIAPAEHGRIFERFYRVDYARSRANGGTGLGLSIVSHIAAAHGGTVTVWSQPGRGSTFSLRLPAHLGTGGAPPGAAESAADPSSRGVAPRRHDPQVVRADQDHDQQELIG